MSQLFSPIRLGGLDLPNRIAVSPMCMYAGTEGVASAWHWAHIGGLAISGAGVVIMEATGVEAIGRISAKCLGIWNDAQEAALTRLIAGIREFSDTAIGIQLGHAGRKASSAIGGMGGVSIADGGWRGCAPSAIGFGNGYEVPDAMTQDDIDRVVRAFAEAAQRADRAGFSLIELHGAHGYLISEFLSPLVNNRTDAYGGSHEKRMRFPLEVIRAVRAVWPHGKAFGMRMNGSDWHPEGMTTAQAAIAARAFAEAGLDYVTVSGGATAPDVTIPPIVPGYMVGMAEQVKRESGITTMSVGMITTGTQAEEIIASGRADLVAVARGFLDDPRWAWHAAAELGVEPAIPPRLRHVLPGRWPAYPSLHKIG